MSWLTDWAGKAEELLNKVDQSAAVALKKDEEASLVSVGGSTTPPVQNFGYVGTPHPFVSSQSPPSLLPTQQPLPPTTATSVIAARSVQLGPPSKSKPKKQVDEEKLFEFLNSSEVATDRRTVKDAVPSTLSIQVDNRVDDHDNTVSRGGQTEDFPVYVDMSALPSQKSDATSSFPSTGIVTDELIEMVSENIVDANANPTDQSTSKVGSLELENRLLHSEITSLNRELKQSLQKAQNVEGELRHVQEQLNASTTTAINEAQSVREYRERESDLRSTLEAKDSQLAVLRVRLDEADHELAGKRDMLDKLEAENRRILEDYSNSSGLHGQTIQAAQDRLQQAEELLERERVHFRSLQVESAQRLQRLEEEVSTLALNFGETKSSLEEERTRSAESAAQLRTAKHSLESMQQELADYKTKAQWILQSKERLIASLKENTGGGAAEGGADNSVKAAAAAFVQLEELRQERDLLKEDLVDSGRQLEQLRAEMQHVESQLQSELDASRECGREMDLRLKEERRRREESEQETAQLKEEARYLREDGSRQRTTLQSRLADRETEIERLRKQLVIRQVNGGGSAVDGRSEMEAKLNALTENLIQKQTMLETLSTEKNSLVFQLERTEQQLKEQSLHSRRNISTAVSVNDDADVKQRLTGFMVETPFDGQVARKMKRVYNTIDKFSFRLGVFLRRYPMVRVLIILYMVLLHFWVMVVLLTYSPEIHDKDCAVPVMAPPNGVERIDNGDL